MYLRSVLFACLLACCVCMDCDNQRAVYATCSMMSDSGLKGTIDLSQPATPACFGPKDPMEMLVSLEGFTEADSDTQHAIIVKNNGDLSNGCQATGPIFTTPGDRSPTGFLVNYDTGNKQAFKAQSQARLNGHNSIIGRTLAIYRGPYPNNNGALEAIGCCVVGHSDGSRFAGMPKPQAHRHDPFSFPPTAVHPSKSSSFLATRHGFDSHPSNSLPFSHRPAPQRSHSDFDFGFHSLGSLGSHMFGGRHFGMDFGGNVAAPSGLSPSISNLKKPPAPPAFPGGIHNTDTGSPLFGSIGDDSNSVKNTFGIDLHDFTQLSDSDKYIPTDGEETEAPGENGHYEEPVQRPHQQDEYAQEPVPHHQAEYAEQPSEEDRYSGPNPDSAAHSRLDAPATSSGVEEQENPDTAPQTGQNTNLDNVPTQAQSSNSDQASPAQVKEADVAPAEHTPISNPHHVPDAHHVDLHDIHNNNHAHLDLLQDKHDTKSAPIVHPTTSPIKHINIVQEAIQKAAEAKAASTNVKQSENTVVDDSQPATSDAPSVSDDAVAATAQGTPTQNQPSSTNTNQAQDTVEVKPEIDSANTEAKKVQPVHPEVQIHSSPSLNFQPLPYDHANHVGHFPVPVKPLPLPGVFPAHAGHPAPVSAFGTHPDFNTGPYGDDSAINSYGQPAHTTG